MDAISLALALILPASLVSYAVVYFAGPMRQIALVWYVALFLFLAGLLLRDGWRGRSPGKRLFALRIRVGGREGCGWLGSLVRNFPLVIPGWNLAEIVMLLASDKGRRSGDRMAGTVVVEE